MAKTRKQRFAEWYLTHRNATASMVMAFSRANNLGIEVKTLNSDGKFVIRFAENDLLITPSEWLYNYQINITNRYNEAKSIYESVVPQDEDSQEGLGRGKVVGNETQINPADISDNQEAFMWMGHNVYIKRNEHEARYAYPAEEERFIEEAKELRKQFPKLGMKWMVYMLFFQTFANIVDVDFEQLMKLVHDHAPTQS